MFKRSSHRAAVAGIGVIQQPTLGGSRGRIHARPVVAADDPLLSSHNERQGHGCFDPGNQNQRESFATQLILNPLSWRATLPATREAPARWRMRRSIRVARAVREL